MSESQERHYNINKLNLLFAVASLVLLGAVVWMFMADYSREWKTYQKEFRALELEKTRVKFDTEKNKLEKQPEYQALTEKLKETKAKIKEQCSSFKDAAAVVERLQAENDRLKHNARIETAKLDAARFRYEEAVDKKHDLGHLQKEFEELQKKVKDLKSAVEESDQKLNDKAAIIDGCQKDLKDLTKQEGNLAKQAAILQRKLNRIDPAEMNAANLVANAVRDLPVIDFANPNYKIEQIVLQDIRDDVNFMQVPKVDRCISCHMGIVNPDYKDAPQPFRTHPNLPLYLETNSPHPMEEFGCTSCHGGRGRGTNFNNTAHVPSSEEQRKEWEKKYHWKEFHLWETPMLPKEHTQAGCFKCHAGEFGIKGAEKLNFGLQLIEKTGCYTCHNIDKYKGWPRPGPDLMSLASKSSKEWTYRWIEDPKSFRHDTWMPSFFGQSNNRNPESLAWTQQEIHSIVHYLFTQSKEYKMSSMPAWGDTKKGKEIVSAIGCLGCHLAPGEKAPRPRTSLSLHREHGPTLGGLGTKASKVWLYNWLKDPNRYHPETRMPNLRLTDEEAADVAAYLADDKSEGFMNKSIPPIREESLDQIVRGFMIKMNTVAETDSQMAKMTLDDKLMFAGKKLIRHYGCFSCHNIAGFETDKPIGTDLTEEGSKSVERLDFGFIPIERTRHAWFTQKLKEPRIFDRDKVKNPDEKLRMPNYHFSDDEVEAIVTALLGFVKDKPIGAKAKPRTTEYFYIGDGQQLIREFNCQGCHIIEGDGGAIQPTVTQWLMDFDNRDEGDAQALTTSFSPPNLIGEGKKVHSEWLFEFLHQPTEIRPWLKVRMPTYTFNAAHLNALIKFFSALDKEEFPFVDSVGITLTPDEFEAGAKLFSNDYFACAKCHIVGDTMPSGSAESWAPNFALAKKRLKPNWIRQWLKNPQDLLPGTKMPNFYDPASFESAGPEDIFNGDENKQIEVLRNYILTLTNSPKSAKETFEVKPLPKPAVEEAPAAVPAQ